MQLRKVLKKSHKVAESDDYYIPSSSERRTSPRKPKLSKEEERRLQIQEYSVPFNRDLRPAVFPTVPLNAKLDASGRPVQALSGSNGRGTLQDEQMVAQNEARIKLMPGFENLAVIDPPTPHRSAQEQEAEEEWRESFRPQKKLLLRRVGSNGTGFWSSVVSDAEVVLEDGTDEVENDLSSDRLHDHLTAVGFFESEMESRVTNNVDEEAANDVQKSKSANEAQKLQHRGGKLEKEKKSTSKSQHRARKAEPLKALPLRQLTPEWNTTGKQNEQDQYKSHSRESTWAGSAGSADMPQPPGVGPVQPHKRVQELREESIIQTKRTPNPSTPRPSPDVGVGWSATEQTSSKGRNTRYGAEEVREKEKPPQERSLSKNSSSWNLKPNTRSRKNPPEHEVETEAGYPDKSAKKISVQNRAKNTFRENKVRRPSKTSSASSDEEYAEKPPIRKRAKVQTKPQEPVVPRKRGRPRKNPETKQIEAKSQQAKNEDAASKPVTGRVSLAWFP